MNITKKLFTLLVGAVAALLVSGCQADSTETKTSSSIAKATEEDPFDRSHKACMGRWKGKCMSISKPGHTLEYVIQIMEFNPQGILRINGWGEDMLKREVPVNKKFRAIL